MHHYSARKYLLINNLDFTEESKQQCYHMIPINKIGKQTNILYTTNSRRFRANG